MTSKIGFLLVLYVLLAIFFTGVFTGLFGENSGAGACAILGLLASNCVFYSVDIPRHHRGHLGAIAAQEMPF